MTDSLFLQNVANEADRQQISQWMQNYRELGKRKTTPAICLFFGLAMTVADLTGSGAFLLAGIPVSAICFAWYSTLSRKQKAERERIRHATCSNFPEY